MGANFEQLLRAFFSCFRGQYFFFQFLWNPYSICSKKLHYKIIKNETNWTFFACFLGKKCFFLELQKILNQSVLQKGLLLQDWVFRLGKFLLDPKIHFLSLDKKIEKKTLTHKHWTQKHEKNALKSWLKLPLKLFFYVLACPKIEFPYNHKQDWLFRPNLLVLQKPRKNYLYFVYFALQKSILNIN